LTGPPACWIACSRFLTTLHVLRFFSRCGAVHACHVTMPRLEFFFMRA